MNTTDTANAWPRAAITARYVAPSNFRGGRICVSCQHTIGRKYFSYPHEATDSHGGAFKACVAEYLALIAKANGGDGKGWGGLSDFAHGVLASGEHVFVALK